MIVLTLPTGHYIAGAAATVALTGVIGALAHRLPRLEPRLIAERPVLLPETLTSCLSFLVLAGLVMVGLYGSRDPMHNLLTLTFWSLLWVGLTLASMFLGNLWRAINPWTGPVRIVRALIGRTGSAGLTRLAYWPAVLGYLGFAWFEIVSLRPEDPAVLARVILGYWLVIFAFAVIEGEDWLKRGEFLTVFYGFIARIAPFWLEIRDTRARLMMGWPGAQIVRADPLPPSAVAFVTLVLAGVTFDGLAKTFFWMGLIGVNPLEFPGRSAVMGVNTAGLLITWALVAASTLGAIALGRWLAGRRDGFWAETGPWMLSFLPIAAGYHGAHYFVALLTGGQFAVAALNDPLFRGDNLFGLSDYWVSFGFLSDLRVVTLIWNVQFAAILGAHLLAVILALHLAGRGAALRAHLPMTALMVGYTVLGLWLLSTPVGA
jgi:hypothetical protein